MTSADRTKIIVAIVGALAVLLVPFMPELARRMLRESPANMAASPASPATVPGPTPIQSEPAKVATVGHVATAQASTPASPATVAPPLASLSVKQGPKLPVVAHIRMGQAYPLIEGLTIYPTLLAGGNNGMFVTLESPVLGPAGVEFRIGGAASDVVVKGEVYSLKITDWQRADQMLTVVLSRKRD